MRYLILVGLMISVYYDDGFIPSFDDVAGSVGFDLDHPNGVM